MDVPLFPAPPVFGGAATSINDVRDVASSDVVTHRKGERHAAAVTGNAVSSLEFGKTPVVHGKGHRRNLVHPKRTRITKKAHRRHVTTEFRVRMTEPRDKDEDEEDDDDVVICANASAVPPEAPSWVQNSVRHNKATKSIALQTAVRIPLRLKFLPSLGDIVDENDPASASSKSSIIWKHIRFLGRLTLSQFGLVWLLSIWAIAGAAAFCATEGPRERDQVVELKDMQKDLAVGLATELRQLRTEKEEDMEPLWSDKVRQYVAKHEQLLLAAVNSGYGETNDGGQLWTFPGCVLFAVSLLTTLGFGAPVPRTNAGRTVAIVFAAIGIPAHFLLIMNVGILLAVRLQKYAIRKTSDKKDLQQDPTEICCSPPTVPKWVKLVPFVCIGGYYIIGVLCFGIARSRALATSVLFPLDFTAAGGLSTTHGYVRVFYAIYLEGAVIIAAVAVAVVRVSATQSLTNIGLRYGLLTEA
ncbi:potassium channel subfamily K member 10-like isoform X3 [Vespula squamosa]|uniref:Potassium channel subfamily K member 10-like isoform X3 n=1 Tax=Vespula squamosa TaxID=30214 RepID=A0ABD1ZWS8_VESSQ